MIKNILIVEDEVTIEFILDLFYVDGIKTEVVGKKQTVSPTFLLKFNFLN